MHALLHHALMSTVCGTQDRKRTGDDINMGTHIHEKYLKVRPKRPTFSSSNMKMT